MTKFSYFLGSEQWQPEDLIKHAEIAKGDVLVIDDLFFGKTSVVKDFLRIDLPFESTNDNKKLTINYQGCKKDTYCYPIISKEIL